MLKEQLLGHCYKAKDNEIQIRSPRNLILDTIIFV